MTEGGFSFESGNFGKLIALPKYALSLLVSLLVPRSGRRWVFGSGIGVGEGALEVALEVKRQDPNARVAWLVANAEEWRSAESRDIRPVMRRGWAGYWETLRARHVIVTHGLGDANRFGVSGARITHLGHGVPLKKLHLDSPVTTAVSGPAPLRRLLRAMYVAGSKQVSMYVAGSPAAARRLRTAYRVDPGLVRVLGDARDDALAVQAADPTRCARSREAVRSLLDLPPETEETGEERLVLFAPTWRDGAPDPCVPSEAEAAAIRSMTERLGLRLVIRSHRLGPGDYAHALGPRVLALGSDTVADITPLLGAFDAVITDYSSLAVDYALLGRPIVWFAPDLETYLSTRGLYEPLEVTASGAVDRTWREAITRLEGVLAEGDPQRSRAQRSARALAARFHQYSDGGSAARVVSEIRRLELPGEERIGGGVFFESFYGRQVSGNPLALDREISDRFPEVPRFWSVVDEDLAVPEGATPVLVGGPDWFAARRHARVLIVNDWLRYRFRRRRRQIVLQTWHGTMLKHLALGRPGVSVRTRLAIRRESRRWSLLLSQNPHSTAQFRRSYAFRGEILEYGYPRDDRLALAAARDPSPQAATDRDPAVPERIPLVVESARRALDIPGEARVLAYAPTWREEPVGGETRSDPSLDVRALAARLGPEWTIVVRGHTRTRDAGLSILRAPRDSSGEAAATIIDATDHPDVNDVILATDLLVTDYSSIMFDAAVAGVPLAFFVPDLADYRDRERGFTFAFEELAPGPLLTQLDDLVTAARDGVLRGDAYARWRETFLPYEDGAASRRVVDDLAARGLFHA